MPRPARKSVSTVSYADAASDSSDGEARTSSRTANTSKNSKNGTKPRQSTGRDAGEVTDGRMLQDSGDTRLDSSSSDESSDENDYEATVKRKKRKTGFLPQVPQGQSRAPRVPQEGLLGLAPDDEALRGRQLLQGGSPDLDHHDPLGLHSRPPPPLRAPLHAPSARRRRPLAQPLARGRRARRVERARAKGQGEQAARDGPGEARRGEQGRGVCQAERGGAATGGRGRGDFDEVTA